MSFPIKKKNLISIVQSMQGFQSPNVLLEQYVTDSISTVDFLYYIAVDNREILDNIIIDLGAGTGRLGLTSLLLGAAHVFAVEVDSEAINIMKKNAEMLDLIPHIDTTQIDISQISVENLSSLRNQIHDFKESEYNDASIVCIMNPPFGIQKKNADRPFLKLAMELTDIIYSIHLSNEKSRAFIKRFAISNGWQVTSIHSQIMKLENAFQFHKKKRKDILTDVYRLEKEIR